MEEKEEKHENIKLNIKLIYSFQFKKGDKT